MSNVVITAELASRLRDKLSEQDHLVKLATGKKDEAMQKLAAVETERNILREVIQLVADGVYEPDEALQKVAQFLERPRELEVVKAAHELGLDRIPTLGTPVSEPAPVDKGDSNLILDALLDMQDQGLI